MKNLELLQQGFGNSGAKRPTAEGSVAGKHLPGSLLGSPYRPVRKNPGLSESCRGTNRRFRQKLPLAFGKNCRNGFSFPHFRSWPKQNRSRIGLDDSLKARPPCGSNCFSLLYLQTSVTPSWCPAGNTVRLFSAQTPGKTARFREELSPGRGGSTRYARGSTSKIVIPPQGWHGNFGLWLAWSTLSCRPRALGSLPRTD